MSMLQEASAYRSTEYSTFCWQQHSRAPEYLLPLHNVNFGRVYCASALWPEHGERMSKGIHKVQMLVFVYSRDNIYASLNSSIYLHELDHLIFTTMLNQACV